MDLYVDTFNKALVASADSTARVILPSFYYGDVLTMNVYCLQPDASGGVYATVPVLQPFTVQSVAGFTLRMVIGDLGNDTTTPVAEQNTWTKSADNAYLYASFSLATTAIQTALAAVDSFQKYFEIKKDTGGNLETIVQQLVTVRRRAISPTTVVPASPQTPISKEEVAGSYMPLEQLQHTKWVVVSPNGTKFLLWVDDDGAIQRSQVS